MSRALLAGWWPALLLTSACTEPPADDATTRPVLSTTGDDTGELNTAATTELTTTDATAGPTGDTAETTASSDETTTTGEPACPPLPDPAPAWLVPLQEQVVAQLSGAQELSPGVLLSDRATPERRAATVSFLQDQWAQLGLRGELHGYSDTGTNVYAALPATIPTEQTVVIGAHFDTVPGSPGANDNATGVAMVLALGRWLQDLPCRELHVILVLFDEEEIGLVGSQAFASWLVDQPVQVVSVHTIDQMGWDSDGDRALELERADPGLFELYEAAEPLAPGDTPLIPTNTGFTDHVSFRELGFDAVGLTEEYVSGDTTPHYHLPSDTFDTVDPSYLASSTALLHVTIGQLVAAEPD